MADRSLPARPDLDQYKKQAKELTKAARAGDADALTRIRAQRSPRSEAAPRLADAQLAIAREHGFESWPRFVREIEARLGDESPRAIWRTAERALEAGDADALERLLREHGTTLRRGPVATSWLGGLQPDFSAADVKSIIVSNHEFESWAAFAAFAEARRQAGSPVAQFEDAVDAIVQGDTDALKQLLERRPDLVRARSMRKHHSNLLHYVGANGVEGFRQRTPKNAVHVLEVLLDAGADVDAKADMYGGSTTVGLVATSIHPENAGVQDDLIDVLIAHGAHVDRPGAGGGTGNLINSCLANGRPGAAEYLAGRGAPIDLEGAAGLGRLDLVRGFFDRDGQLANGATATQMKDGFSWACEYGRTEVVEFMLKRGMEVGARLRPHQQTGLHWAAMGPHVETVKLLLRSGSPIDVRDESFGVTALEWTLYGWGIEKRRDESGAYYEVVGLLTKAGATVDQEWLASSWSAPVRERLLSDARMSAALAGRL
jgi:hypothetical protein